MRRRSNNHFELGLELPGLRLARLVAVPLFHTPESACPKTRATEGLILLSVSDTGCLGTRMDCTVLQMSARQSTEAPSQPSTGEGAGLATQNRKPTLHNSPTSCSTVPEKGSTQPGHTHTGHRLRLADELGQARWAGPCLLAPGPSGVGMGQTQVELPGLFILKAGSQDAS